MRLYKKKFLIFSAVLLIASILWLFIKWQKQIPGIANVPGYFLLNRNPSINRDNVDPLVYFTTSKDQADLIDYYTRLLQKHSWTVEQSATETETYHIIASNFNNEKLQIINVFIMQDSTNSSLRTVGLLMQNVQFNKNDQSL